MRVSATGGSPEPDGLDHDTLESLLDGVRLRPGNFNSFSLLVLDRMPARLTHFTQRLELAHRKRFPFNTVLFRRHGADLMIRARLSA